MVGDSADALVKQHHEELARLRSSSRSRSTRLLVVGLVLFVVVLAVGRILSNLETNAKSLNLARAHLLTLSSPWGEEFAQMQYDYQGWLADHGIGSEVSLFSHGSEALFRSAASFIEGLGGGEAGFFGNLYLGVHSALLRLWFFLLATWRLIIACIIVGVLFGAKRLVLHTGRDVLGQTGNGRVFFSGVRISLDKVTSEGAPVDQVTGLACPPAVGRAVAQSSSIAKLLESFTAVTSTNLALAGIILRHPTWPSNLADPDGEQELNAFYTGAPLPEYCEQVLRVALELHRYYCDEVEAQGSEGRIVPTFQRIDGTHVQPAAGEKLSAADHIENLRLGMDRVLTDGMKAALARLDAPSVATVVLAIEASKTMSYSFDGGRWIKRSSFPQLSARAILHSIPEFALEYDFELRATIRRAIIFGARSSAFGPVKFPVDLREESRAARQWVEILMSTPNELQGDCDEVELLGLVGEIHGNWKRVFFDGAAALDPEVIDGTFATPVNLFFMPVARVVRLMRRSASRVTLDRLAELVALVSQRQRMKALNSGPIGEDTEERDPIPPYAKILAPFTPTTIRELIELHALTEAEIRDWSAFRVVLSHYGWLGRRVGDRSVPESSVIFGVFGVPANFKGVNEHGLFGHPGIVPMRATQLQERWGKAWRGRFLQVESAKIAETRSDFDRLLQGQEDEVADANNVAGTQA